MRRMFTDRPLAAARNWQAAQELFMLRCRSRNLTQHSLNWYEGILKGLRRFLAQAGSSAPRDVSPNVLRSYLDHLRDRGLSSQTIDRTYGALRCLFRYLAQERIIPQNPITLVERPRKSKTLIKPLDMDQARRLLAQAKTKTYAGFRNWTMMLTMLDTGLRLSEVLSLRRDQIDWPGCRVYVRGKGDKERAVPFGTAAKKAMWEYSQWRGEVVGQDTFFLDQFGGPIHPRHFQITMKRYGKAAGIEGVRVSPHTLRHTFATQYILNGGDAFSLQEILGHSTLEMVKIYVRLANRDVALLHRKFSPMDRMGASAAKDRRSVQLR